MFRPKTALVQDRLVRAYTDRLNLAAIDVRQTLSAENVLEKHRAIWSDVITHLKLDDAIEAVNHDHRLEAVCLKRWDDRELVTVEEWARVVKSTGLPPECQDYLGR